MVFLCEFAGVRTFKGLFGKRLEKELFSKRPHNSSFLYFLMFITNTRQSKES